MEVQSLNHWKARKSPWYVDSFEVKVMETLGGQEKLLPSLNYLEEFVYFWLHRVACEILAPQSGTEKASGSESTEPNHWSAREFPRRI